MEMDLGIGRKDKEEITSEAVIDTIGEALDGLDMEYNTYEGGSTFMMGFKGEGDPMIAGINVGEDAVHIKIRLGLAVSPESFAAVLAEANRINLEVLYGAFSVDPADGRVYYDYAYPYKEGGVSPGFFLEMLMMLVRTADERSGDLKKASERGGYGDMYV